jgi:hypothetical protein
MSGITVTSARKVIKIMATADDGCTVCVRKLVKKFKKAFPDVLTTEQIVRLCKQEGVDIE